MYKKRSFNRAPRKHVAQEAYEDNKYEAPRKEELGHGSDTLQAKAYRDLDNIGVIDVKADPNAEMSYGSFPYTIIGRTAPVLDANYPGYVNIAGNSITLMQNDTTTSQLMNIFDVGVIVKKINYNYLPIRSDAINVAFAGEMIKSIEQAVSFGFSTMLTQLPFASATYATDMPIPSQYITNWDPDTPPTGLSRTLAKSAGYYAAMIHYQCVLQALVQPISKYIELRSLEKEMMRMSFRTEAPLLTQLFGLFKKSSFIAEVNTIGTVVINEYFDVNWYHQNNTLQCVPSRKTKGMVDPLLTIVGTHAIPRLTIDSPSYDSDNLATSTAAKLLDPETFAFKTGVAVKLEKLVENAAKLMNPAYILRFVRLLNRNALPAVTPPDEACASISAYGEAVKVYLSYIARFAASFSTAMSNIRTFLDKLDQSGMIYWKKGVSFFVDKISQLEPHYNALLNDVFAAAYSGADKVIYDAQTKRWRAWAFWNKYVGIPEFDRVSGGCFLTFGLRDIQPTASDGSTVDFNSSSGLIPILFSSSSGDTSSLIVTRSGASSALQKGAITNASFGTDHYLTRLNVMNNATISLKQPLIDITISNPAAKAKFASAALLFIGNVFGYGATSSINEDEELVIEDKMLDPDYVAFVDLEIEDVSNQMIVYARNYAPFRVDTPNSSRTMGFARK